MSPALPASFPSVATSLANLAKASRFLDAYGILRNLPAPESWPDPDHRITAARLLRQLGDNSRARRLFRDLWRADKNNLNAFFHYLLSFLDHHGPYETLRLLEQELPDDKARQLADNKDLANLCLLRARLLSQFRDFDASEEWLQLGLASLPGDSWASVEMASIRLAADRYDEALQSARQACELSPDYRSAISMQAHLLTLRNEDDQAIRLLSEAHARMQCQYLPAQLITLLTEQQRYGETLPLLDDLEHYAPLGGPGTANFCNARRAEAHYNLGNLSEARRYASLVDAPYQREMARRLDPAKPHGDFPKPTRLPVSFVRQHHMTCAPATLSALGRFWDKPIDHLALASVVTYDGTPDHEERNWLESNGWLVREFRVDFDSACALLEKGIPFTLVTTWVRSAHLQAVIGCDRRLRTLFIRDPYFRNQGEFSADILLESQAPFGPRGMVLLPPEKAALLEGINLPDTAAFDDWYRLRRALHRHDRPAAEVCLASLAQAAPGSRLELWGRRQLASYDDNPLQLLDHVRDLRRLHPNETNLRLDELDLLQRLGLQAPPSRPSRSDDLSLWRIHADLLASRSRDLPMALRLARRLVRLAPLDPANLHCLASILWKSCQFQQALRLFRRSATLADKSEAHWNNYFTSARLTGQGDLALDLLRARWKRLAPASPYPAQTLAQACGLIHQHRVADEVLSEALTLHPLNGYLRLHCAEHHGRTGDFVSAQTHLAAAADHVPSVSLLHTRALLARWQADHRQSLDCLLRLHQSNPLDNQRIHEIASLTEILDGRQAARVWLECQLAAFPHFVPLRTTHLNFLAEDSHSRALAQLDHYLAAQSDDLWALREKARILLRVHKPAEALPLALRAESLDDSLGQSSSLVAIALCDLQRNLEARDAIHRSLALNPSQEWLYGRLLDTGPDILSKQELFQQLLTLLNGQLLPGDALLTIPDLATGLLSHENTFAWLEALRNRLPGEWQTWSASLRQARLSGDAQTAHTLAREGTRRFPRLPRLWLDLADTCRLLNLPDEEESALLQACELSPGWPIPALQLASLHERRRLPEQAVATLRECLRHNPLEGELRAHLARILHAQGRANEARTEIERTLALCPHLPLAWTLLGDFARLHGEPEESLRQASRLADARPGDHRSHLRLAHEQANRGNNENCIKTLDTVLDLAPASIEAHDLRACCLTRLGRYDDALRACTPPGLFSEAPLPLLGRLHWVEYARGNHPKAIAGMEALLANYPQYSFGWFLLEAWLEQQGKVPKAIQAATKLCELEPDSIPPLLSLARLQIRADKKKDAAEILGRALRLAPADSDVSLPLIRLQCDIEDFDGARETLVLIRLHSDKWHTLLGEIHLHRRLLKMEDAALSLQELALAPDHARPLIEEACALFTNANWLHSLRKALEHCLSSPNVNPCVGFLWMQTRLQLGYGPRLRWLDRQPCSRQTRVEAYFFLVQELGRLNKQLSFLRLLFTRWSFLRSDDALWGQVSYALASFNLGFRHLLLFWMKDWRSRSRIEPWMLYNLTQCLLAKNRRDAAREVISAALALPADQTRAAFTGWAALHLAQAGDHQAARQMLATHNPEAKIRGAQFTATLADYILRLADSDHKELHINCKTIRQELSLLTDKHEAELSLVFLRIDLAETRAALAKLASQGWLVPVHRLQSLTAPTWPHGLALVLLLLLAGLLINTHTPAGYFLALACAALAMLKHLFR